MSEKKMREMRKLALKVVGKSESNLIRTAGTYHYEWGCKEWLYKQMKKEYEQGN